MFGRNCTALLNDEFAFSCVLTILQLTVTLAVLTATESGSHMFMPKKTFELKSVLQKISYLCISPHKSYVLKPQGGSNMTGTDLCVNKPHCAAAVRP